MFRDTRRDSWFFRCVFGRLHDWCDGSAVVHWFALRACNGGCLSQPDASARDTDMSGARCPSLTHRVGIAQASEPLALSSSLACTLALRACSGGCFIPTRRGCEFFSRTNSERVSCLLFLVFCRIRFDWASVCFVASCFSTYDRALPVIHFVHAHPLRTPSFFILMKLNVIAYHKLDVSALIRPRTRNW